MAGKRFEELDFVKAAAIFLVVFCHHQVVPADSFVGNLLMLLAWAAVPCFFLCSGYVMLHREETPDFTFPIMLVIADGLIIERLKEFSAYRTLLIFRSS